MKKSKPFLALITTFSLIFSLAAFAEDSVRINGEMFTCTNTCDVTTSSNGNWSVTDCCGGTVTHEFEIMVQ